MVIFWIYFEGRVHSQQDVDMDSMRVVREREIKPDSVTSSLSNWKMGKIEGGESVGTIRSSTLDLSLRWLLRHPEKPLKSGQLDT